MSTIITATKARDIKAASAAVDADARVAGDATAGERHAVDAVVARARIAQRRFASDADPSALSDTVRQARYDRAALAIAWALMEPGRNEELSRLAVEATGLGNVADKMTKNHRKTLGLLRDIQDISTTGVVTDDPARGLTEIARPVGVVGAVVPSTNPAATPVNNAINSVKCGNAIVLSPSPAGAVVCERLLGYVHAEFDKSGIDRDLVQMVPSPSSKVKTQHLMESVDLLIVTGSQDNVRRAYRSGTPAIGVGAGNATVIIDEDADLDAAARRIAASKTFDNATSCSSENVLIVVDAVRAAFLDALHRHGGRLLDDARSSQLKQALFQEGHLNRHMIAKDIDVFLDVAGIEVDDADSARFVVLPGIGVGREYPESGEKLSLAVTLYSVADFDAAAALAGDVLRHQGAGHSIGLHASDAAGANEARALALGRSLPTCRVIVNQAHCFATGGAFDNALPFSLSMGCGSWGGNSIDENLDHTHFMNITRVVRPIKAREPALDQVFEDYWNAVGR